MKTKIAILMMVLGGCAYAKVPTLAQAIGGCRANDAAACERVEQRLADVFVAGDGLSKERPLAKNLATAAVTAIRDDARFADAERDARVLERLFAGDDKQLDASPDRELARALAAKISGYFFGPTTAQM
jgi:hypothetical protein